MNTQLAIVLLLAALSGTPPVCAAASSYAWVSALNRSDAAFGPNPGSGPDEAEGPFYDGFRPPAVGFTLSRWWCAQNVMAELKLNC